MAELSVEEIRQLARGFLTGQAEPGQLENMKQVLDEDPQLGLELLTQMQSALDEVAPAQLSPEQWKKVDEKVEAVFAPLASGRRGFHPFRFLAKLFKRSGAKRRKAVDLDSDDDVLPMPEVEAAPGMDEEMAPISDGGEEAPIAPAPVAPSPAPAAAAVSGIDEDDEMAPISPASEADMVSAAVDDALDKGEARAAKKRGGGRFGRVAVMALGSLLAFGLVGGGAWMGWQKWGQPWWSARSSKKAAPVVATKKAPAKKKVEPKKKAKVVAEPTPTVPAGPPAVQRGMFQPPDEILPAEVAPATPVPAGWIEPMGVYEESGYSSEGKLPFPGGQ